MSDAGRSQTRYRRPRWFPRRLWLRAFVAGERQILSGYVEPWQVRQYAKASAVIGKVWDLHGKPYCNDRPGFGPVGKTWWCSACLQPWPCATALLVIDHGSGAEREYEPLTLVSRPAQVSDTRGEA